MAKANPGNKTQSFIDFIDRVHSRHKEEREMKVKDGFAGFKTNETWIGGKG